MKDVAIFSWAFSLTAASYRPNVDGEIPVSSDDEMNELQLNFNPFPFCDQFLC